MTKEFKQKLTEDKMRKDAETLADAVMNAGPINTPIKTTQGRKLAPSEIDFLDLSANNLNFLLSAWLKSYRTNKEMSRIRDDIYYPNQQAAIQKILLRSKTVMLAAPDDHNCLYGFITYEINSSNEPVIHYAYVKHLFRECGIMRSSLIKLGINLKEKIIFTADTNSVGFLKRGYNLEFNPFLVR